MCDHCHFRFLNTFGSVIEYTLAKSLLFAAVSASLTSAIVDFFLCTTRNSVLFRCNVRNQKQNSQLLTLIRVHVSAVKPIISFTTETKALLIAAQYQYSGAGLFLSLAQRESILTNENRKEMLWKVKALTVSKKKAWNLNSRWDLAIRLYIVLPGSWFCINLSVGSSLKPSS